MKFAFTLMTVAAFAFALSVSPVAAYGGWWYGGGSSDVDVEVEVEDTTVNNNVTTSANTGRNSVNGRTAWGHITTGNAYATTWIDNNVNNVQTTVEDDCGCLSRRGGDMDVEVEVEDTTVNNNVTTRANTGGNSVNGSGGYHHYRGYGNYGYGWTGGTINTGEAVAVTDIINNVNLVVTRVSR